MHLLNHSDPIVQQVLDIWLPRFLAGGVEIGDIARTIRAMDGWRDWGPRWMETAALHETLGEEAVVEGRTLSATQAFLTASRCYHLAYFLSVDDLSLHHRGLKKMVECHDRVIPFERPTVEKVRIPFEGAHVFGLFTRPVTAERPPVAIVLPGLDSTKETRHGGRGGLLRRGLAVLSLDGPGQGEMSLTSTIRPDYEVVVAAAIDWLVGRDDIDAGRIGVIGSSLGGYYAARGAAFEPRVKATLANSGPYDWAECFDDLPSVTQEAFRHYSGASSAAEARERAEALTLRGASIPGPLFVIQGGLDPLIPTSHGARIAALGTGEVVYQLVPEGNHGVNNLRYRVIPKANDWLANHLGGTTA
ncbi:MAG: alpha/beta hydrolase family protein [Acidimicrobiia bacterium]